MYVLPTSCKRDSTEAAGAGVECGRQRPSFHFVAACHQPKAADDSSSQTPKAAAAHKSNFRTLKYYPPPLDNTDQSVDVIDHGSEVLVIRREPSPPPRLLSAASAHDPGRTGGKAAAPPAALPAGEDACI